MSFILNFGATAPWFPPPESFLPMEAIGLLKPSAAKGDADRQPVIHVMCGLPASGKTTWAMEHAAKTGGVIVGTDETIRQIQESTRSEREGYDKGMIKYYEWAKRVLNFQLRELIPRCGRDVILDQTNLVDTVRQAKLAGLAKFRKVCVVCVVKEGERLRRSEQLRSTDRKSVPSSVLRTMVLQSCTCVIVYIIHTFG